jgi:F0F1-type ATP synthase alpha subunit
MVEALKQKRFVPMAVEDQVAVLFAGTQGFLDDLPVDKVGAFLDDLPEYLHAHWTETLAAIDREGELSFDTEGDLRTAIFEFHKSFSAADPHETPHSMTV